jgi:hypothetical protein
MLTKDEAVRIAQRYVDSGTPESDYELALLADYTIEFPSGWMFFYDVDRTDGKHGDVQLAGNGPLIISSHDGSLHVCGTAEDPEFYIEAFEKYGTPFPPDYWPRRAPDENWLDWVDEL